jgi:hypothetical protein
MWVSCLHATAVAVRTSSESVPLLELLQEYDGLYYFLNRLVALFLLFCLYHFATCGDLDFRPAVTQMLRFHRRARSLAWWGIDVEPRAPQYFAAGTVFRSKESFPGGVLREETPQGIELRRTRFSCPASES